MVPAWLRRHGETVVAPIALAGLYAILILTSGAGRPAQVVAGIVFLAVLALYLGLRRLRIHAAASRLAAIGEPEQLLALVERELPRRLTPATRIPLHVFAAMAHNLRGDWSKARAALDRTGIRAGERATRSWQLLWAAADVTTRTESGDPVGARATYQKVVMPFSRIVPAAAVELIAVECEARLMLVEGDPAAAAARVQPLLKDVRLGPAARAQLCALAARAALAAGDPDTARRHAEQARTLAPRCALLDATFAARLAAAGAAHPATDDAAAAAADDDDAAAADAAP